MATCMFKWVMPLSNLQFLHVSMCPLLQYITNLLDPNLPPNWWSISTKNPTYILELAPIKGAEKLVDTTGYTVRLGDFKIFPEDKRTAPDRNHISLMAAELLLGLLAHVECIQK